jgi:cation transport regulator ChaB
MPYSTLSDLPDYVKESLPEEAQHVWRAAFNSAFDKHGEEKAFPIAWAAVKNAGWTKTNGEWIKESNVNKICDFEIKKTIDEKRLAFGWAMISRDSSGAEVWDLQNDNVDPEDLEEFAYKYVKFYRDAGELHINSGMGVMIESVVTTLEKQQVWGIPIGIMPVGWWVGFYVNDDSVWDKVKEGKYKAFSIEGVAERVEV